MRCPFCGHHEDKVVDSREVGGGASIRRRRECLGCHHRYTSYERIELGPYRVIKKDQRREDFDRNKLMSGLLKACEKRAVPVAEVESIVNEVEVRLQESPSRELSTKDIGTLVMDRLKVLDQVAYVRFASVYRQFSDASEFLEEIKRLVETQRDVKEAD
ncbi:MAG: transcriptional regulator NrdR [Acidobacteriota bacterium]